MPVSRLLLVHHHLRVPSALSFRVWPLTHRLPSPSSSPSSSSSACACPSRAPARVSFSTEPAATPRRVRGAVAMANVTRANFWEAGERLQAQLADADFVAFDFEMTGVETTPWRRRHCEMDTAETRYQHLKISAESFAVWQCGVCSFKWDEPGQKFVAYPYNFYIFPRDELPVEIQAQTFTCQTSSLEFLAKHHFDFNATVYNGISYLSLEQEEIARVKLGLADGTWKAKNPESEREYRLIKTADVMFTEKVRVQVGQWRDGVIRHRMQRQTAVNEGIGAEDTGSRSQLTLSKGRQSREASDGAVESEAGSLGSHNGGMGGIAGDESSSLRPCYYVDTLGNYQARLVKQVIRKHYQDLVVVMPSKLTHDDRRQVRIIFTSSKEDKGKLEEELEADDRRDLESVLSNAVGFRKIIDVIRACGKPLVGHNCFLDLAHLHDKFIGPLPSTVKAFAVSLRRHFACILDTKYLLKAEPTLRDMSATKSSSLAKAYQELCQGFSERGDASGGLLYDGRQRALNRPMSRVKLEIASDLQRYSVGADTALKHEAGFDAYMTGALFAQICHLLRVDVTTLRSLARPSDGESRGFASYANLLMLQTFRNNVALDLTTGSEAVGIRAPRGPTRHSSRDNVALLWGAIPTEDPEKFLRELVQKFRTQDKRLVNVDIYPLDATAAFAEFKSRAVLESFMKSFQDSTSVAALITDDREEVPIKVATFEAYERLCRSPMVTPLLGTAADLLGLNRILQPNLAQAHDRGSAIAVHSLVDHSIQNSVNEGNNSRQSVVIDDNREEQAAGSLEPGVARIVSEDTATGTDADSSLHLSNEQDSQRRGVGLLNKVDTSKHGHGHEYSPSAPSASSQNIRTKRGDELNSLRSDAAAPSSKRPRESKGLKDRGML